MENYLRLRASTGLESNLGLDNWKRSFWPLFCMSEWNTFLEPDFDEETSERFGMGISSSDDGRRVSEPGVL